MADEKNNNTDAAEQPSAVTTEEPAADAAPEEKKESAPEAEPAVAESAEPEAAAPEATADSTEADATAEPAAPEEPTEPEVPGAPREERLGVRAGQTIRVHQRITDVSKDGKERERIQVYEGVVLGRRGGATAGATMTVRKKSGNVHVEKIFPLWLPTIEKIETVAMGRVRRAKLNYLRLPGQKLKKARVAKK